MSVSKILAFLMVCNFIHANFNIQGQILSFNVQTSKFTLESNSNALSVIKDPYLGYYFGRNIEDGINSCRFIPVLSSK